VPRCAKLRMRRTETPKLILMKFGMLVDIPDMVTYTNFGDHRLRGFWFLSNFPLSHWLSSSPLQHSRTTVRVCDYFASAFAAVFSASQLQHCQQSAVFASHHKKLALGTLFDIVWIIPHLHLSEYIRPHFLILPSVEVVQHTMSNEESQNQAARS